jgi:hypothetical protein
MSGNDCPTINRIPDEISHVELWRIQARIWLSAFGLLVGLGAGGHAGLRAHA